MKKSKVITAKLDGERNGKYYFLIEFENGDRGKYSHDKNEQDIFIVGQEAEYLITNTESNGKTYTWINLPKKAAGGFPKKDMAFEKHKQQLIIAQSCLDRTVELIIAEKVDLKDLKTCTDKFMTYVNELAKKHNEQSI